MKAFIILGMILFTENAFSQSNKIFIELFSNKKITKQTYCTIYVTGAPYVSSTTISIPFLSYFPLKCDSINPVKIIIDHVSPDFKIMPQLPGSFICGDSILIDLDNRSLSLKRNGELITRKISN